MMKYILKKVYIFCIKTFNTFISLLSVLLFSSFSCNKSIKKCSNELRDFNECILMGNGPSLSAFLDNTNEEDLKKYVFAVNFFCNTKYFEIIKPSLYTLLDPNIFLSPNEISNFNVEELIIKFNKINWKMNLFLPNKFKKSFLVKRLINKNINRVFYNTTPIKGYKIFENWVFKKNLGMPEPQTVINAAIFLAINLKFNKIHLYGVEQSWLKYLTINDDNSISVGLSHFYKGSDKTGEDRTLSEFLMSQVAVFESHMRLQEYSQNNKQLILNHTPGSYIDAYTRVE